MRALSEVCVLVERWSYPRGDYFSLPAYSGIILRTAQKYDVIILKINILRNHMPGEEN